MTVPIRFQHISNRLLMLYTFAHSLNRRSIISRSCPHERRNMRSVWPSGKEQYQDTTNWHIGSSNGNSRFFDGEIREVAIWDSALNAAQAAAVYAGTTPSADYPTVVTSYTYDAAGHLLTLTDPVGNTTSYTYNYMGLVATETNEKNATRYYSYDALGRLVSKTDRNGRITTYTYDTVV